MAWHGMAWHGAELMTEQQSAYLFHWGVIADQHVFLKATITAIQW